MYMKYLKFTKGLYTLKNKNKKKRLSLPTDIKTCYKDKLIKTGTILLVQGQRDIPTNRIED